MGRPIDPEQTALDMSIKSAAWDETQLEVKDLVIEVKGLRRDIRLRPFIAAIVTLLGGIFVALLFWLYYIWVTAPRYDELNKRVDRLEMATTTTSTPVPTLTTLAQQGRVTPSKGPSSSPSSQSQTINNVTPTSPTTTSTTRPPLVTITIPNLGGN